MTFEEFQATRKLMTGKEFEELVLDGCEHSSDVFTYGIDQTLSIELTPARNVFWLFIENMEYEGDLISMEKTLYDWAVRSGYFE